MTLMFIGRKKKHVVVDGGFIVPYDHLILCTGLQYQVPKPTGLDVNAGATNSDLDRPDRPQPRLLDAVPKNVFVVNDAFDAAVVLYWLEDNVVNMSGACVFLTAKSHVVNGCHSGVQLLIGVFRVATVQKIYKFIFISHV